MPHKTIFVNINFSDFFTEKANNNRIKKQVPKKASFFCSIGFFRLVLMKKKEKEKKEKKRKKERPILFL